MNQGDHSSVEPSMDLSLAADPYVKGRAEELEHTAGVAEPNLRGLQKLEYQREVRELIRKLQTAMPSLLPWLEGYVISIVRPEYRQENIDRALEHIFERVPDATPRRAAEEVIYYKRMGRKYRKYVRKRAEVVKMRLYKRKQRAECEQNEDSLCPDEPMR